ncbi:sigma-70 family RNA polymerase sigma factor [Staphylococcus debuckii]|uniref:sigma-70 family RNA polymerase sigma factor n=1 Tax=Staphylococcus debuckii TaxID=2044912 RepID=UPI000F436B32|nr:sigma-70 family RNA polymerase sigma factor [Staphylococcus debuckii]AYU54942.1 sigma-70 family RNA polymerase sigma factor [Staphylococcus debuckii]
MIYDKESVRAFILSYESRPIDEPPVEQDIDDFFSLDQPTTSIEMSDNFEEHIFFNELSSVIENIGTEKEFVVFDLLAHGWSYEKIGEMLMVTSGRVQQIFSRLLDKLP